MMPIPDGNLQAVEHQIDYKQKYKALKKKLKFLVYEQECFLEELRKAQRKLLKISRDRSFLLDRLLQHEKIEDSSGDSDATASSDSEADGSSANRKRKAMTSPGQLPYGIDPSLYAGGGLTPASASLMMAAEPSKKKARTSAKKGGISKGKGSLKDSKTSQMTREELERHLESKQNAFGIEKAPAMLPMEIFSNENSNPDSESAQDTPKEEDDSDLVVDAGL